MFYPTKPAKYVLNSGKRRLLSDRFNMTVMRNSLIKSSSPQNVVMHIKTANLLENFFIWFD